MISFRSDASLAYTCDGMSTIDRIRSDPEKNLFQEVTKIFERDEKSPAYRHLSV